MTKFIRPAAFAELIGVSGRSLARLVATGKIVPAAYTDGGHPRYMEAQAAEWLERTAKRHQRPAPQEHNGTYRGRGLTPAQWAQRMLTPRKPATRRS